MIKVVKDNAEYDIEEKYLKQWLQKGYKQAETIEPKRNSSFDEEIEDETPKRGRK